MIIEIDEATTTNNKIMRMGRFARHREHARYDWLVKSALAGRQCKPRETCIISVTRYGSRLLDWDNMGGGLKFLLDALTHNRVIMDDNPRCIIRLHLYQRPCKRKEEKTIVEIE
jgi:Holliday junction resolvase RusA-like endonuclease